MELQIGGKHILITGGSGGIGFACAREFLLEGADVTLVGRNSERLADAELRLGQVGRRVGSVCADLGQSTAALRAIDDAEAVGGPVHVLVNCAGAAQRVPFLELNPDAWNAAMQAKFVTYMNVVDPMIKRMAQRREGSIVNVVGMGGKLPMTTHLSGGAANAALMLASAGLALAYRSHGVRVNVLNPAKTATGRLAAGAAADARQRNSAVATVLNELAESPIATPEDVAGVVVFLASPRAAFISGAVISMDGAARPMVV